MEPIPEWLATMADAAGRTAFTEEFDFGAHEAEASDAAMLPHWLEQEIHGTSRED